jgi:hypothetical protein
MAAPPVVVTDTLPEDIPKIKSARRPGIHLDP